MLRLFEENTARNRKFSFPPDGMGTVELKRQKLVDEIINLLEGKLASKGPPASLYIHGMKASGKTILLELLAKNLQGQMATVSTTAIAPTDWWRLLVGT